jgi:hypothetical protein
MRVARAGGPPRPVHDLFPSSTHRSFVFRRIPWKAMLRTAAASLGASHHEQTVRARGAGPRGYRSSKNARFGFNEARAASGRAGS